MQDVATTFVVLLATLVIDAQRPQQIAAPSCVLHSSSSLPPNMPMAHPSIAYARNAANSLPRQLAAVGDICVHACMAPLKPHVS